VTRSFRQLHAELSRSSVLHGEPSAFSHHSVFVMLHRSTRNGGCRRLKDLRTEGKAAGGVSWPNPGVYTVPELALRVLRTLEQDRQTRLLTREKLCPIEAVAFLAREEPQLSPRVLESRYKCFDVLRMMGLDFKSWSEILREFEDNESSELKLWSERILSYLRVVAEASNRQLLESDWDAVLRACEELESAKDLELDGSRVSERNPFLKGQVRFLVPALKEAYPLEKRFLAALSRHIEVEWMHPRADTANSLKESFQKWPLLTHLQLSEVSLDTESTKQRLGFYWAFEHEFPGPAEVTCVVPGSFAIDMPVSRNSEELAFVRALRLWADYNKSGRPAHHPYARDESLSEELRHEGFPVSGEACLTTIKNFLIEKNPQRASELRTLVDGDSKHLPDWVCVFDEHDFFCWSDLESERPIEARISPRGVDLLCLEDIPFGGHATLALWTHRRDLIELTDPDSPVQFKKRPLPAKLVNLLESRGLSIPDPGREAQALKQLLIELEPQLAVLDIHGSEKVFLRAPPRFDQLGFEGEIKLSPSTVEQYFRCHFKFYLSRLLELGPDNNWDPTEINVLSKGTWIHRALELFFKTPDWESPSKFIHENLLEGIDQVFDDKVSENYKKILRADAEVLTHRLTRHLTGLERDIQTKFPTRRFLTELWIEAELGGEQIRGSVDRIDIFPNGEVLLWDYKSGSIENSKPLTQIRGGRMQWFIYRSMLESLSPQARARLKLPTHGELRVVGGGYVNPMQATKSSLFVFPDTSPELAAFLESLFKIYHHPVRSISASDTEGIRGELVKIVQETAQSLRRGDFTPLPRVEADCQRCEHQALCGRPFLREAT
jgi:RecB family exonuclease